MAARNRQNQIPKKPFKGIEYDLLYSLMFQGDCLGYEQLSITDTALSTLTPPKDTQIALIAIEADPTATQSVACRFSESPSHEPTITVGMPLVDLGIYEVKGADNIKNFKIICAEAGKTAIVNIQYYG